jgi:hypothetical protein
MKHHFSALILALGAGSACAEPVSFTGSIRLRPEVWNWFDGEADGSYAYMGNILRMSVAQQKKGYDWQIEFAAPFLLQMPTSAIAPAPQGQFGLGATYSASNSNRNNAMSLFAKQGYVRWKGLGGVGQSIRVGRFEFIDGSETTPKDATLAAIKRDRINQRLVGSFGWSHVGRSFDGVQYLGNFDKGKTTLTLLSALPTRGAFQVDGWGNLKVNVNYLALTRQYGGGKDAGELRGLAIYYQDWRHVLKTDSRPQAVRQRDMNNIRVATYGGHWIHKTETQAGSFDFMGYGLGQFGRWGRIDHGGWAANAEFGWQPKAMPKLKPWLRAGYFHGSGDNDPNDGKHGTFFQVLPTPRPFARFPFYDMVNNEDFFVNLIARPHKDWTLRSEFHALRLANRNDLWYLGGGAYQPWTFGYVGRNASGARSLANQWDVSVDWNINARVNLNGYVGFADGKSVMQRIYPKGDNASFGYIELNYKF